MTRRASPPPESLRICYVLSYFHPVASGAERQALAQGAELVRRGHVVHVLTRHLPGQPRDEVVEGLQVHRWIRPWSLGPAFAPSFVLGVIRALRRLRPEYDLIHTHQALWESISTGLAQGWLSGAPVLIQPASSGYFGEAEEMSRTRGYPVLRRLALRNPLFAAISEDIASQWRALGVPRDHIVMMASGVDAHHFHPGPSSVDSTLPPGPRVLFTGRLHPQKNLDLLLDIWPEVLHHVPDAHLILLGDGPDRSRLECRTAQLGLDDRVVFTGAVPDPAEYLRAADAFILPSVAEGMSNSLLEAMATGLPCIASRIGGNTDLIETGLQGLLPPIDDRGAWTSAIVETLTDRSKALAMGQAARKRVEEEYALEVVVDRYVDLYKKMLR